MTPVISVDAKAKTPDVIEADGTPPGAGPGFVGKAPERPRGKTGPADAGDPDADDAAARTRRADSRADRSETGASDTGAAGSVQVGWGSQADDANAPSPFRSGPKGSTD